MPDSTLERDLLSLRQSVGHEISRARREAIAELARAVQKIRSAGAEPERRAAVNEARQSFADHAEALELFAAISSLTAPAAAENLDEAGARRFARVRIAEIQLYHAAEVKAGRTARDLYSALQPHIDAARQAFQEKYLLNGTRTADYLHSEILRALANDDPTLLGPGYPGPLA